MKRIQIKSLSFLVLFIGIAHLSFARVAEYRVTFVAEVWPPQSIETTIFPINMPAGANATITIGGGVFKMECDRPGRYTVTFFGIGFETQHIDFYASLNDNGKTISCEPIRMNYVLRDAQESPTHPDYYQDSPLFFYLGDALKPTVINLV